MASTVLHTTTLLKEKPIARLPGDTARFAEAADSPEIQGRDRVGWEEESNSQGEPVTSTSRPKRTLLEPKWEWALQPEPKF